MARALPFRSRVNAQVRVVVARTWAEKRMSHLQIGTNLRPMNHQTNEDCPDCHQALTLREDDRMSNGYAAQCENPECHRAWPVAIILHVRREAQLAEDAE